MATVSTALVEIELKDKEEEIKESREKDVLLSNKDVELS